MQQYLFNPLKEVFLDIQHIQFKVDQLKKMQMATDYSDIKISFKSGNDQFSLIQLDTDLSLVHELRLIIQASIELYEQQILDLKLNF
jgi:hypothetical protein